MGFEPLSINEIKKLKNDINELNSKILIENDLNYDTSNLPRIAIISNDNKLYGTTIDTFKKVLDIPDVTDILKYVDFINEKIDLLHGLDSKYIGYLYGGYKAGKAIDHIQRYDTIQEVSTDIYTTGKQVRYVTGITTDNKGYFTWSSDNIWYWNEFDFVNETLGAQLSQTLNGGAIVSAYNMGIGDKAMIFAGGTTRLFSATTKSFKDIAESTLTNLTHTTRQALNNDTAAFIINRSESPSNHYIFEWASETVKTDSTNKFSRCQYTTGLSKDKTTGYWIDRTCMGKVKYDGSSILSSVSMTYIFKAHFGESHTLQNYKAGYVMAGYDDNIGDFGGGQHGYAEKMDWNTEVASVLPKLAFPQSSGEMVQH